MWTRSYSTPCARRSLHKSPYRLNSDGVHDFKLVTGDATRQHEVRLAHVSSLGWIRKAGILATLRSTACSSRDMTGQLRGIWRLGVSIASRAYTGDTSRASPQNRGTFSSTPYTWRGGETARHHRDPPPPGIGTLRPTKCETKNDI